MQKINRLIAKEKKLSNTLFRYEVIDENKNKQVVSSIQEYELGEEVQVIWSDLSIKYNTPYLKKIRKDKNDYTSDSDSLHN